MLLLQRMPSTAGLAYVRYEDTGEDVEVSLSDIRLNLLTAANK